MSPGLFYHREIEEDLLKTLTADSNKGVILAGVIGCGKTTLIENILDSLSSNFAIFKFTGDDTRFRNAVLEDSNSIQTAVRSQTQKPALVFVDEVQKSEAIFDALKIALDQGKISFVVSGSNPDFLNTTARKRLQRRASYKMLLPFSLPEILAQETAIGKTAFQASDLFFKILTEWERIKDVNLGISLNQEIQAKIESYLTYGGLPLVHLASNPNDKLTEIQKTIERGWESLSTANDAYQDPIRIELAKLHSHEFTYQGIFGKTGLRRRELVNSVIDSLINQGYLLKKKPMLLDHDKKSYLSICSYLDPGIVTYLTGTACNQDTIGARVEGLVHSRLMGICSKIPLKTEIGYYKPYTVDNNSKVKFKPGEIDFIYKCGKRLIPIEVKTTIIRNNIDTNLIENFVKDRKCPFGVILYGGVPQIDIQKKIIYWPYWLI